MDAAHEESKIGALGAPFPGVHIRIVDEHFRQVPPGTDGEIIIRGAKISPGYWNDEEANRRSRRDGWFLTGDVGRIDEDGFVWIEGRLSDMINRGGLKVHPAEVEEVLRLAPGVADVAVVGEPHERLGEVPTAFVVERSPVSDTELDALCRAQLAPYKVPARFERVDALPRNDNGKVVKAALIGPRDRE
jgi:acyl-CoA synthetase (AMP-forming)/AMP-acid ligase II